ncbi:MAG: tRNA uridine-5-carboxymethylaminomethyl(34) synthesis GTPase MnmE [Candidatus Marinimicrobia bacterium]|nr:tRNA uridine-5-carboxymethylaminomethyl(34) synthesis GTPase MnmE [Candidatus Neomarinimicrobiota bacterium]
MEGYEETIAALSTPEGVGGLAVVRISGPNTLKILNPCLTRIPPEPFRATFTSFLNPKTGSFIDDVVVTFYKSPLSYTGEDLAEISCHGSRLIPSLILEVLFSQGARLAQPGEFTRRAFLHGKMDLTQVEAIADMIYAETENSLKSARMLLKGRLSEELEKIKATLIEAVSLLEISLDFIDQDIEPINSKDVQTYLQKGLHHINALVSSYRTGKILHDGARIPIIGKPNVGKSSLLNAILQEERVITSEIPGTTRDYIEEQVNYAGYLLRFFDTAGLRETEDFIEKLGVKKTQSLIREADLLLFMTEFPEEIPELIAPLKAQSHPTLLILNKRDKLSEEQVKNALSYASHDLPILAISALNETHIAELMDEILNLLKKHYTLNTESVMISHLRHQTHLKKAQKALLRGQKAILSGLPAEFIVEDIREALSAFDDITGKTTSVEILNHIFNQFCVGK